MPAEMTSMLSAFSEQMQTDAFIKRSNIEIMRAERANEIAEAAHKRNIAMIEHENAMKEAAHKRAQQECEMLTKSLVVRDIYFPRQTTLHIPCVYTDHCVYTVADTHQDKGLQGGTADCH